MNKLDKFQWIFYLLLSRNIQLLFNGYSNELTGFWLLVNIIFCLIFFKKLLKNSEYNENIIIFILGFTYFLIEYSSFRDWNKMFNTYVIIILKIAILFQLLIIIKIVLKSKNSKKIFLIILFFILSKVFLEFLTSYYLEPRKIVYSTNISSIKNDDELQKIVKKMPMIEDMEIINDPKSFDDYFDTDGSLENVDEIILISIKHSVDYESMDLLVNEIKKFITLQNKNKKFIKIYFINEYNYTNALAIYDLKNDKLQKFFFNELLQVTDSFVSFIFVPIIKLLKGIDF